MAEGELMGKLIRDIIPEIILADGKQPIVREMGQEEYLIELDKKLSEEVNEYKERKSLEEMADVLEVLYAICEARGYAIEDLLSARNEKMEKRGAFKKRLYWEGNISK